MMIHISIPRLYRLRNSMGRSIKLKSLLVFIVILSLKKISQMESQNDKDFFKCWSGREVSRKLEEINSDFLWPK